MKYVWVVAKDIDLGYTIEEIYEHLINVPYKLYPRYSYTWQGQDKPLLKGKQLEDQYDTEHPHISVFKQEVK